MNYLVVGYLPGYATNKTRGYDIAKAPGDQLTHLIYCFAGFAQNGSHWEVTTPEPKDETKNFLKLAALKQRYPALNLMISIGGWNNSQKKANGATVFSTIAADANLRKAFVESCLNQFILTPAQLFDGIDIDWEFPQAKDYANFVLLVHELRTQLNAAGHKRGRHFFSSIAIATGPAEYGNDHIKEVQIDVDWMNVMSYNLHGPNHNSANAVTNFNAPLFTSKQDPTPQLNIDTAIKGLLNFGVNARKLLIGIPAYAHSYAGVNATHGGLYQPYSGPGPGTYQPDSGILTYKDIMDKYLPSCGPPAWDDFTQSSSMYCKKTQVWISPNLDGDVFAKASYVIKNQLGGLMLWELGADKTDQYRLAEYMSTALHHTVA